MIPARKSPLIVRIVYWYFRRKLRGSFAGLHVRNGAQVPKSRVAGSTPGETGIPVILYGNHSCWWDAVTPLLLSYGYFGHDSYAMMEEKQLVRYRFFQRIGCFSVRRDNARSALRSIAYATELLKGTDRALWIFPQGELTSIDQRPLQFFSGAARLMLALEHCWAVPVAFRYEFIGQERPEIFASFGEPWRFQGDDNADIGEMTSRLEALVEEELDRVREDIVTRNFASYETIVRGRVSVNERFDTVRGIE
jgi:chlorobactene lauroyltransferase